MPQPIEEASLMGIPIELRYRIFAYSSTRDVKPKKALRYWFEDQEIKDTIAKMVAENPDGVTPQPIYKDEYEESDSNEEPASADEDDDEEENEEDEEEEDEENEEEEDEENEEEEDEENEEEEDEENEENENGMGENEAGVGDEDEDVVAPDAEGGADVDMTDGETEETENQNSQAAPKQDGETEETDSQSNQAAPEQDGETKEAVSQNNQTVPEQDGETEEAGNQNNQAAPAQDGEDEADEDMMVDDNQNAEDDQDAQGDIDENTAGGDGNSTTATSAQPPAPPRPKPVPVKAHSKWRHIPKFFRINQYPPPIELFLINKQLSVEAKDWFYKVAVLNIDATASFAHMSFFEEALGILATAPYSPMRNIKKAEVSFVWDTTWLRAEKTGYAASVFQSFLDIRAEYVLRILQQAPELEQLVIHWHDSAEDEVAKYTLAQVLEPFIMNLEGVETKTEEHYIASDVEPHARSIAGKRRTEFQSIMDKQCDTF